MPASPRRLLLLLLLPLVFVTASANHDSSKKAYIIHMEKTEKPTIFTHHFHWYTSSLNSISPNTQPIYTYDTLIHGFSALLTPSQAQSIQLLPGVLSVLPQTKYQLHTTRTPEFLHISKSVPFSTHIHSQSEVIIAVLDTGIWPESRSFSDQQMPPIPSSWKGRCDSGTNFTSSMCNRKLIGAKYFYKGYESALGPVDTAKESLSCRDDDGHGTHTASTAAGAAVHGANLLGYAAGVARGMAMHARIAAYKVCWIGGCFNTDILAAMEAAVNDGVHVISMSLGGGMSDYYKDSVAIGAFSAVEKGVFISCSAGNSGPSSSTLSNVAPWITTVGAGTIDRDFPAVISLGNGNILAGVSLYRGGASLPAAALPLIYAGNASAAANGNLCLANTLDSNITRGKVVFCDRGINPRVQKGAEVKAAGGLGMLLGNTAANGEELVADAHLLPAAAVGQKTADLIKKYMSSDPNPTVRIVFRGTVVGVQPSPVVAAFSSRGPNSITSSILKPDLIAPGVNILAGWTGVSGPSGLAVDTRRVEYNIISGTSMSCPHVGGLAALLKGVHPGWTPAAIRSALMTTSYMNTYTSHGYILDSATGKAATPFDFGSGHVDPAAALDPGLVYEMNTDDYLGFLCALNYTRESITIMAKRRYECRSRRRYVLEELNYPSFAAEFEAGRGRVVRYKRRVTNVGGPGVYTVKVGKGTEGVRVRVWPRSLNFTKTGEVKGYVVTVVGGGMPSGSSGFTGIEWYDGVHSVKSPMAFTWV